MAHEWDRGVLNESSWHGMEEIGVFAAPDTPQKPAKPRRCRWHGAC